MLVFFWKVFFFVFFLGFCKTESFLVYRLKLFAWMKSCNSQQHESFQKEKSWYKQGVWRVILHLPLTVLVYVFQFCLHMLSFKGKCRKKGKISFYNQTIRRTGIVSCGLLLIIFYCRYYPALKTLEQLEHLYLPRVANYQFAQQMRDSIPK